LKIGVIVASGLAETPQDAFEGELLISEDACKMTWIVPASPEEKEPSVFTLHYCPSCRVMKLQRTGDYVLRLAFADAATMPGDLTTPHGNFELEIETKKLFISDKLLCPVENGEFLENAIDLSYLLDFGGGEKQKNQLSIHVKLAMLEE
jgi:hypothetical protein